ncbi:MAG: LysR family transcriptional regulator [Deltaproteobacteria bacterium]|nr:LysR family transcriptional regulator [Deltaproteobacteria bacterium]
MTSRAPRSAETPDLELLRLFSLLYAERHLTRAAARAGIGQPAMSRALARLRAIFDDPLFVRAPTGMTPTPRADALAPAVDALQERVRALVEKARFDPATLRRTFVIAAHDMVAQQLVAGVVVALSREAPGVDLSLRPLLDDVREQLASVDLLVGTQPSIPVSAISQFLRADEFLCAVRVGHPVVRRKLTLEQYVSLAHVQIAPRGTPGGPVDDALAAQGLARRVAVRTHSFFVAPLLIARSDLILTAPARMLAPLADMLGLRTFPPPLPLPGFRIHQAWHPRVADDPAHRWFRRLVAATARQG